MSRLIRRGDRVQYTAQFLRNFGLHTGDVPFMVGTVIEVKSHKNWRGDSATVRFDGDKQTYSILLTNLVSVDRKHMEAR
jgi:hypothetical protein